MKILSLLEPWATLLVQGNKLVETRSWPTYFRGPVFIHASGALNKKYKDSQMTPAIQSLEPVFKDFIKSPDDLPFGKIIGMVEICTCIRTEDISPLLSPKELAFGDYTPGRWAWECRNAVEFNFHTETKGQLGIRDFKGNTNCPDCDKGVYPKDGFHHVNRRAWPCTNVYPAI